MKHITFYLDFISPYAYLAFETLPQALLGLSYSVSYQPVLLGALLQHHGQLGPAEIEHKRPWTYRHVQWLGQQQGVELTMPARHPFKPLPLLRLATACAGPVLGGAGGDTLVPARPNRFVCETIFRHAWRGGLDANDATRLSALEAALPPHPASDTEAVKAQLKTQTDEAIARGVFGVPAFAVDDKLFWGFDALPMLRDYLQGAPWFDGAAWNAAAQLEADAVRKK